MGFRGRVRQYLVLQLILEVPSDVGCRDRGRQHLVFHILAVHCGMLKIQQCGHASEQEDVRWVKQGLRSLRTPAPRAGRARIYGGKLRAYRFFSDFFLLTFFFKWCVQGL